TSLFVSSSSSVYIFIRPPPISTPFPYTTLFRSSCPGTPSTPAVGNGCCANRWPEPERPGMSTPCCVRVLAPGPRCGAWWSCCTRSEEHTSELQSREKLVCRLLLEKKKNKLYASG